MRITPRMKQVLQEADLKLGEVNDVPWSTWKGLINRGLVTHTRSRRSYTTRNGIFPVYHRIVLTETGIGVARSLQAPAVQPSPERAPRTVDATW